MSNCIRKLKLISTITTWIVCFTTVIVADEDPGVGGLTSRFPATISEASVPRDHARIVFSGHSLTDVAVPAVVAIAKSKDIDLKSIYQSVPGSTIRYRTEGPPETGKWGGYGEGLPDGVNLIEEFRNPSTLSDNDRYDILVVTERHDILGTIQWESTLESLYHFHNLLLESSADGQTYFYQSWLDIDKSNPKPWIDYESNSLKTWECISSKSNLTLASQNLPQNIRTIGAGWALSKMVEVALTDGISGINGSDADILDQIFSDSVHLTPVASWFIGAYTFGEIFNQTPQGAAIPADIEEITGNQLLEMAWTLVNDYRARTDKGIHDMADCRQHISEKICSPFWTYFNSDNQNVQDCKTLFGTDSPDNPFRWPDPNLKIRDKP